MEGKVLIQRKFNGCCVFGVTGEGIFSRRTSTVTGRKIPYSGKFPHIVKEMNSLGLPPQSLPVGEMAWFPRGSDIEDFWTNQRMTGSGDSVSLKLQKELGSPIWILHELLFISGKPAYLLPYHKRYEIIEAVIRKAKPSHICIVKNLPGSIKENYRKALKEGWEGLVLKDPNGVSEVTLDDIGNNSPRPNIAWKLVPVKVVEAIIVGFEKGSGANKHRVGHVFLEMYRGKERVSVGKVGIFEGYTQKIRDELAEKKNKWNGKYFEFANPIVAKIAYTNWTDKGHLFQPKVIALTNEKGIEECRLEEEMEE